MTEMFSLFHFVLCNDSGLLLLLLLLLLVNRLLTKLLMINLEQLRTLLFSTADEWLDKLPEKPLVHKSQQFRQQKIFCIQRIASMMQDSKMRPHFWFFEAVT